MPVPRALRPSWGGGFSRSRAQRRRRAHPPPSLRLGTSLLRVSIPGYAMCFANSTALRFVAVELRLGLAKRFDEVVHAQHLSVVTEGNSTLTTGSDRVVHPSAGFKLSVGFLRPTVCLVDPDEPESVGASDVDRPAGDLAVARSALDEARRRIGRPHISAAEDESLESTRIAYEMELAEHRSTTERAHRAELAAKDATIAQQGG